MLFDETQGVRILNLYQILIVLDYFVEEYHRINIFLALITFVGLSVDAPSKGFI